MCRANPILLSSIVAFELWYGISKGQRRELNARRLELFLAGPMERIAFDDQDARDAGKFVRHSRDPDVQPAPTTCCSPGRLSAVRRPS